MQVGTIVISANTTFSASYLRAHAECTDCPCDWARNFSDRLDAEQAAARHRCKGETMQGRSIMQMLSEDGDVKYREWSQEVEASGIDSPRSKFLQGRLQGLCEALALMRNPHNPNPAAVADEIQRRVDGD